MPKFILLNLDPTHPLSTPSLDDLITYLQAFFNAEIRTAEVPRTPIAPEVPSGWEALRERTHCPLQSRPGRSDRDLQQICAPDLLYCMRLARENPAHYGVQVEDCVCLLGLTNSEFYQSGVGLRPDEPASAEKTRDIFVGSAKQGVGACSFAHLDEHPDSAVAHRQLRRKLCTIVSTSILSLIGLRTCPSHTCAAYFKPIQLGKTPLGLCFQCEEKLIRFSIPEMNTENLIRMAAERYSNIAGVLKYFSQKTDRIKLGYRKYKEYEEEVDWLQLAEEIIRETERDRFCFVGTEGPQRRRRSLLACLREAHERQPARMLHRTLSEPFFKKTCLVDMTQSAPFRHESGTLENWSCAVVNRKHVSGGHYVEMGGSLRAKTVSCFVDSGLNASLIQTDRDQVLFAKSHQSKHSSLHQATAAAGDGGRAGGERTKHRCALTSPTVEKLQRRRRFASSLMYTVKDPSRTV